MLGPKGIAAISAVLPKDTVVGAVGGVSEEDFADYAKIGVRTFGLGSSLYKPGMSAAEVGSQGGRRRRGLGRGFREGLSMAEQRASIFSDVVCELGEGPSYDPATGTLFWFDIVGKKLLEKTFPDGPTIVHDLPFMASAIATIDAEPPADRRRGRPLHPRRQDRRADAAHGARSRQSGDALQRFARPSRPARSGSARWPRTRGRRPAPSTGSARASCARSIAGITHPELDLLFAGRRDRLFHRHRRQHHPCASTAIRRPACRSASRRSSSTRSGSEGWIDGSVVDADGVLWNARWGGARVDAYVARRQAASARSPCRRSNRPARPLSARTPSRIAVTSAWKGMDAEARAPPIPHGGKTFLLDIEVSGRFEPHVVL